MVDTSRSYLMDFTFRSVPMWGTQTGKLHAKCAALKIAGRQKRNNLLKSEVKYSFSTFIPNWYSVPFKKNGEREKVLRLYKSILSIKSWHEGWPYFSLQRHWESVQNVTNVWWGIKDWWSQRDRMCVFQSRGACAPLLVLNLICSTELQMETLQIKQFQGTLQCNCRLFFLCLD